MIRRPWLLLVLAAINITAAVLDGTTRWGCAFAAVACLFVYADARPAGGDRG